MSNSTRKKLRHVEALSKIAARQCVHCSGGTCVHCVARNAFKTPHQIALEVIANRVCDLCDGTDIALGRGEKCAHYVAREALK